LVQKHWVDDQRNYFRKASVRNQEKVEVYEKWVRNLFTATAALTILLVILVLAFSHLLGHSAGMNAFEHWFASTVGHERAEQVVEFLRDLFMVIIVVFPGAAATLDGYSEKLAFAEQAKQYQRMRDLFEGAANQLTQSLQEGSHDQAHRVIQELGEEALAENGDWVLIHRERDVEVPHAG